MGGFPLYLPYLAGMLSLALVSAVLFLLVPRERIRLLLPYGIVFGAGLGVLQIAVLQNQLGYWLFRQIDFLTAAGIPLFVAFTWLPAEIIFAHLLMELRHPAARLLLWLFTGVAVSASQYLFILNRMLSFHNWTLLDSFFLTLATHVALAAVLHLMGYFRLQELLKSS